MSFSDFLIGNQTRMESFDPGTLKTIQDISKTGGLEGSELYGGASDFLKSLFSTSPNAFTTFAAPYMQQFQQQIAPGIAERFAGMGTGAGASSSSALYNSLAQAGSGLQNQLASLQGNMRLQAAPQALGFAQQPIQNRLSAAQGIQNQFYEIPGQEGLIQGTAKGFAQGFGQGLGKSFGGGLG